MQTQITNLNEYIKKHGTVEYNMVMTRFDQAGALLRRKPIDAELVEDLFGHLAITIWERIKPSLEEEEKRTGIPHVCKAAEYLYNEMKKREQAQQ